MSEKTFFVDLRPDKDLLDPSFGGYKLSLDSVPVYRKSISSGVDCIQPNDDQFSFSHVKLFSLHNHLHVNPFTNQIYFVDKNWNVTKIKLDLLNKLDDLQIVGKIPALKSNKKRNYNVSMAFASLDSVIVSDGAGTIYIMSVNNKENVETWTVHSSNTICEGEGGFLISDVYQEVTEPEKLLHVVIMYVEEKQDKDAGNIGASMFHTVLEWVALLQTEHGNYVKKYNKKLQVDGNVEYVSLEPGAKAIFIIGDKIPKWIFDSERGVLEEKSVDSQAAATSCEKIYTWMQDDEGVTVWVPITKGTTKSDVHISINENQMEIKLLGETLLSGELSNKIENDLTAWSYDKNRVEIQLMKQEKGLMWQNLIVNDDRGEQIYNPELVGKVHEQLAHMCSDKEVDPGQVSFNSQQLEECDALCCNSQVLVRVNSETQLVTHEVNLSSFQWLFKIKCSPGEIPAICLRHDVDACVWQFTKAEEGNKSWPYKHIGTFFAFGYVQASKNQKKYLTSPPDLSYAIVCETSRHLYLYRQPSAVAGELRNRVSGKKVETVSKQQLVNLDSNEQILGIHATNSLVFILSENTVYVLSVSD